MFLTIDIASPIMGEYTLNTRAKNRIINYWPKTTVNGVEVFDILYMYVSEYGVIDTPAHRKIYELLGMSIEDLEAETYDGINKTWLYFKYGNATAYLNYTNQELFDYAHEVCKPDLNYHFVLNYSKTYKSNTQPYSIGAHNTEIRAELDAGFKATGVDIVKNGNLNPASFIAAQDINNDLFTRNYIISKTTIRSNTTQNIMNIPYDVTYTTVVRIDFTIKPDILIENCTDLFERVRTSDYIGEDFLGYVDDSDGTSLYTSTSSYYDYNAGADPLSDIGSVDVAVDPADVPTKFDWFLTVGGVRNMRSRDFAKLMEATLDSDYKEQRAKWWAKIISVVIVIIAVWLSPFTGGASLAGLALLTAFATWAATTVFIVMLAQMALMYVLQAAGQYANAMVIGKALVVVQQVSKVIGYIALFTNVIGFLQKGFTKAVVNEAGKEVSREVLTSSDISMQMLKWLNTGVDTYTKYEASQDAEKDAELQSIIDQQEEILGMAMTPKMMAAVQENFDTYAFLDDNAMMDQIPHDVTQGLIDNSTTKYFS